MSAGARAWAALAGRSAGLLVSLGTCVFALVLVPSQAAAICAHALAWVGDERAPRRAPSSAGWLAIAQAAATLLAVAVAYAIGDRARAPVLGAVLATLAAVAVSAAWAPVSLAPFALVEGEGGVVPAIVRSFELSARRGGRSTIALGASVGAIAGTFAAIGALADDGHAFLRPLAFVLAVVLGTPTIALRLATAYHEATSLPAFDARRDPRVLAGLRTLVWLVAPAAATVALALLVAALRPTPMRPLSHAEPRGAPPLAALDAYRDRVDVPGEHGLVVLAAGSGVSIETADGGGAGIVDAPPDRWPSSDVRPLLVVEGRCGGRDAWIAIRDERWETCFDDEGVRLDDSIADRVATRLTRHALALLALALLLGGALALVLARSLRDARALDAPAWSRELGSVPMARIDGALRLGEGARIALGRRTARLEGDAHVIVEGGEIVVALPPEIPLVAMDDVELAEGSPVAIVAPTEGLRALGPRQGSIPFPPGGRLVPGDRDHAAERVLGRAARAASLLALGIAVALALAAAAIVLAP